MKKGLVFGIVAIAVAGITGLATAGLPCAAYSTCNLTPVQVRVCSTVDVIWSPLGNAGYLQIDVTVNDCLDNPVDTCDVRLDYGGTFDPEASIGAGVSGELCGSGSVTGTTDANGHVSFTLTGGGCGTLVLDWTATALCASPEVELCSVSDTLCVKSTDINGDGNTQFVDSFKYLPMLSAGSGYCGDFAACSGANAVTFPDNFVYLPALATGEACAGAKFSLTPSGGGFAACSGPINN